jgi:putative ABC transport system permease protein
MNDIRLALRGLRATPIVSMVAIVSLTLGIGLNTAIFSLVNSLLLRPLPVANPEQLTILFDSSTPTRAWSNPLWEQIRARANVFDGAFAWSHSQDTFNLARGGEAQFINGIWASGDMFRVLGVQPVIGRTFTTVDDRRGGGPDGPVTVISHDFWQRHYGGVHDAIGRPITLNGVAFTVIGVTPEGFFGPDVGERFDVIVPIGVEPLIVGSNSGLDLRGRHWLSIMIRRRADQSLDAASAAMRGLQQDLRNSLAAIDAAYARDLQEPLTLVDASTGRSPLRQRYRVALVMLQFVAIAVLVIACVNVANLMMARAVARRHEMSLRVALGASHTRLAGLLMAEAVILAAAGALPAIAAAQWVSRFVVQQISTPDNVVYVDLSADWRVWAFAATAALMTAVLFGVAPAWQSMRADPIDAMRERGRGAATGERSLVSTTLVGVQVALSLVLIVAAGLFAQTSSELASRHVGTSRDRVLLVSITAPMTRYTLKTLIPVYERVLEGVRAVPGVERAAISDITPASGAGRLSSVEFPGTPLAESDRGSTFNVISPGWLQTYGVRLVAGRDFANSDRPNTPQVALVNKAFARRFLSGENPVGRSMRVGLLSGMTNVEIVGVVEDTVYRSLREAETATVYTSTTQRAAARSYVNLSALAAHGDPMLLSRSIATAVREVDPELVLRFRPLTAQVSAAMSQERLVAFLSGAFGVLALVLAALGLYGVTAYTVNRRRAEIAMRMALGADASGVVKLVMTHIAILVAAGILCGAMLSLWATRFVGTLVWGLEPRDPTTFAAAAMILATVAGVAGALPAWRASRIDPADVLKET